MSKAPDIPADKLKAYEKLVATNPDVDRKGASMPYTSCNGHMFSFLTKDGTLALRLPQDELEAFLKKYKTSLCEQHGRIMTEYAVVPDGLLKKTRELQKYFELSFGYVGSLKPKATTRKAPKKAATKKKATKQASPKNRSRQKKK